MRDTTVMNHAKGSNWKRIWRRLLLVGACIALPVIAWAQWTTSSNDIYNSNSGKVGIGVTSPTAKLEVNGAATIDSGLLKVMAPSNSPFSGVSVGYSDNLLLWQDGTNGIVNASSGDLYLRSKDVGHSVIFDTGKVGIGTSSPSTALHVVGDVTVSGNISAKYQDIAEWVPSRYPIVPGNVVVLDSNAINSVVPSNEPYDTRVAGVVSAQPGLVLGVAGKAKVKVATMGRVKVRVNATEQPIRVGDLLVTSSKEGMAMRSEPMEVGGGTFYRPGTLIGKALESLPNGEGEILVLLSLQ